MFQWWWQKKESYKTDAPYPQELANFAGPKGLALVKAYENGTTTPGWGEREFMKNYTKGVFNPRVALHGYERKRNQFAFVMRSMSLIAIDIDGKNGGIEHAAELLGNVPITLAETSKSGNGFHLFFRYSDEWDEHTGFSRFRDAIGIVQGVDIRATGCVYHYDTQRWNGEPIAELPKWIEKKLESREARRTASVEDIEKILVSADDWEILMLHQKVIDELNQSIPRGRRNNTLFAIGSKLHAAKVENWEEMVWDRAIKAGLPVDEADKIVANIARYGEVDE